MADEIYRTVIQLVMAVEAALLYLVPSVGPVLSFACICWLYALYCFEYTWMNRGWGLASRLRYFEERWSYFAGFGAPFAAATFFWPQIVGAGVFAVLFPAFVIMAVNADPETVASAAVGSKEPLAQDYAPVGPEPLSTPGFPERLPVFRITMTVVSLITRNIPLLQKAASDQRVAKQRKR